MCQGAESREIINQTVQRPLVSIITVCLNAGRHLEQTISSVAAQTFRNYEHIIVDGGSADNTVEIIRRNANRLTAWVSEPDQGIADAMNKGADRSSGQYLYFLNADDYLINEKALEYVSPYLQTGRIDILVCPVLFQKKDRAYEPIRPRGFNFWANFKQAAPHQGAFFSKQYFYTLGRYDTSFKIGMDFDFFLRAKREKALLRKFAEPIAIMRDEGISSRRSWSHLSTRFAEERRSHFKHANGVWRGIYTGYWSLYLPYRRLRDWLGCHG